MIFSIFVLWTAMTAKMRNTLTIRMLLEMEHLRFNTISRPGVCHQGEIERPIRSCTGGRRQVPERCNARERRQGERVAEIMESAGGVVGGFEVGYLDGLRW